MRPIPLASLLCLSLLQGCAGLPRPAARPAVCGSFTYFADSARFHAEGAPRSLMVATEGAYLALERAYLAARPAPGAPLRVCFEGRQAEREGMEGGMETMWVVERVGSVGR